MTSNRFVNKTLSELLDTNCTSILDYEHSPVLTLEEAVEKIIPPICSFMDYITIAKQECNRGSTLLTSDESAAIYLYTMPIPFYSSLNNILRAKIRHGLKSWFGFLKLFITALKKLPSMKATIWRGVNYDDTLTYVDNDVHIWWSINSCSLNPHKVQSFLGESGTLFVIDAIHGKDISAFSAIPDEQEVVLMPGTRVRCRHDSLNFIDRLFVVHLEEINSQSDSQSKSNYLFEQIRQEYQRNSRLHRIMNPSKSIPIEHSYINLSIVTSKDQREKEKQLCGEQHADIIMDSFEQIYGMKTAIDVKDIFKTCKNSHKQVLVFGRAGIGKSIFCRYIAYQWARGSYWSEYELLVLISLRHLTSNRYPPLPPGRDYSLIDLIKKEIFPHGLSEKEENLLKNQFDMNKTLWILDGYDEIVQNVPPHLEYLFEQLLRTPHHIITSRPYLNTLSYDVQMEITGFTDENIEKYVQQFFDQMKNELNDVEFKTQALLKFLKSNPSVWGVAHIPVNLELICSLWSDKDWSETADLTITILYTMITEWLCRCYLSSQNYNTQRLSEDEVYQRCQKELAFLESLAFHAMESKTIIIRPSVLRNALNEAKVSLQEHPHVLNIGILKSCDKQGTGTQIETKKDHYFVHLSFQEYFAARYLINALQRPSPEKVNEFIKHQKYNQRYALVFTFTSGLLGDKNQNLCSSIFWDTILGEPLDLVGIRHMQLVISCLEATSNKSTVSRYTKLLQWIARCIENNVFIENSIIVEYISRSLQKAQSVVCDQTIINVIINLLQYDDVTRKKKVLSFISQLEISNPSAALITAIITTVSDENEQVRHIACEILGNMTEKAATKQVISKLVNVLGDESEQVRLSACKALGNMGEKAATNEVISKLVKILGDENISIRRSAGNTLGKIAGKTMTNEVISQLITLLKDDSDCIRSSACEVLGKMGENAATNKVISQLVNALEDESELVRSSVCKAFENMGEKAATNEVIMKLVNALGDDSDSVRWSACEALGKLSETAVLNKVISKLVNALEDTRVNVRFTACEALRRMGEKAATSEVINQLVNLLGDESEEVRLNACDVLEKLSETAAMNTIISKLTSVLGHKSCYTRQKACKILRNMGNKAATNEVIIQLMSVLDDDNARVRSSACKALGNMGEAAVTNEVIGKLVNALGDKCDGVRSSACKALGKFGEKAATNEVTSKLVNALEDTRVYVRLGACEALENMGEKAATNEVIIKLVNLLGDDSDSVRWSACEALGKLSETAVINKVISKLLDALEDTRLYVRSGACEVLRRMGDKGATNEVISQLVIVIEDESEEVRLSVCEALGNMGKEAATNEVIDKLVNALEDKSDGVRSSACKALGKFGEKAATSEVISKLVNALGDTRVYVRLGVCEAFENMGEKVATNEVINKLMDALRDGSESVRLSACTVLTKLGEKVATNEVISKLVDALGDVSESVRWSVRTALAKLGERVATNEVICQLWNALEDTKVYIKSSACEALGEMGERAASLEMMNKLVDLANSEIYCITAEASRAIRNIWIASGRMAQVGSKASLYLCRSGYELDCSKNIPADQLIDVFFDSEDSAWLYVVTRLSFLQGVAVTVTLDKVIVFGRKDPVELDIPTLGLRQQLIDAFIDEGKQWYLFFDVLPYEVSNKS